MEQNLILSNERVDDLQLNGLKIIQNPEWFCFGTDAVLLSDFAAKGIKKDAVILDMCSGNGIISLLLSAKSRRKKNLFSRGSKGRVRNGKTFGFDERVRGQNQRNLRRFKGRRKHIRKEFLQ